MNQSNQVSIDEILIMMWAGGLDWATSDDFKELREGDPDKVDEAYLRYQNNLTKKAKASILEALPKVEHSIFCKVFDGAHISHCTCEGKIYSKALDDIIQALKLEEK